MKFIWDNKYSVNIKDLDDQHKNYFKIANKLGDLIDNYSDKDEQQLAILFDELLNYALYHLSTEEEHFKKCKYEEAEEHTRIHDMYREEMRIYRQRIREPEEDKLKLGKEVQEFAVRWLSGHIKKTDKRYIPNLTKCLSSKKLK